MGVPAEWTGELVGKMHNARVTLEDLAVEMGVTKSYVSMILNGSRSPTGAHEKLCAAFDTVCEKRKGIGV